MKNEIWKDVFYIIPADEKDRYLLCLKQNHYCLAAVDGLDSIKNRIEYFIKKYKNPYLLSFKANKANNKANKADFEIREVYIKSNKHLEYEPFILKCLQIEPQQTKKLLPKKQETLEKNSTALFNRKRRKLSIKI